MLAVFAKQLAGHGRAAAGKRRTRESLLPEEEDYVNQLFDRLYEYLPKRQRGFVQEQIAAGPGVFFGCAWADALSSQLANNDDVSVFFMGSIENNPKDLEDAQYILDEYHMACGGPNVAGKHPQSLDVLVQLEGGFAFVLFDHRHGRLLVARDAEGVQPLYWGEASPSEGLLFSTDRALVEQDCGTVNEFPAGAVFVSEDGGVEGSLTTIGAEVLLHPELCKVESANNIVGLLHQPGSSSGAGTVP